MRCAKLSRARGEEDASIGRLRTASDPSRASKEPGIVCWWTLFSQLLFPSSTRLSLPRVGVSLADKERLLLRLLLHLISLSLLLRIDLPFPPASSTLLHSTPPHPSCPLPPAPHTIPHPPPHPSASTFCACPFTISILAVLIFTTPLLKAVGKSTPDEKSVVDPTTKNISFISRKHGHKTESKWHDVLQGIKNGGEYL